MENMILESPLVERLPWHKPEVMRLVLVANTGLRGASVEDGDGSLGEIANDLV